MKLLTIKQVEIGDMTFPVTVTNSAMIEYEEMTGESFPSFKDTLHILQILYCTAKAGSRKEGKEFNYDFEAFKTLVDDYYMDLRVKAPNVLIDLFPIPKEVTEKAKKK
jgi:hypothetical protein